jgi:predicted DNA-binding transcriptional regulator AlpA
MKVRTIQVDPAVTYGCQALAELLGVTPRSISRRVARKQLPKPVKVGRDPLWPGKVLAEWLEAKSR